MLVRLLPEAAVAPILVFVGLQITAQAFLASPARHAPAVAMSFLPAVAALVLIEGSLLLGGVGKSRGRSRRARAGCLWSALLVLGNGFILTALVWGSALVAIIDRRLRVAAAVLAVAAVATLFGSDPLAAARRGRVLAVGRGERDAARAGRRLRRRRVAPAAAGVAAEA